MRRVERVLAVGSHPDDVDFLCGGTLALYAQQDVAVTIAIATRGDIGSPAGTRDEIAWIRRREAQEAAAVIGAEVIWLGYDDEFLFSQRDSRISMIDAIRRARPDVMFVLSESDYHPDHRTAGTLARDARVPATVPLIETRHAPLALPPATFVTDTYSTHRFEPEGFVDITSTMDTKLAMLTAHRSQEHWIGTVYGTDMLEPARVQSRFRGAQAGTTFAEGFQLLRDYPHTGGWELLPLTSRDLT